MDAKMTTNPVSEERLNAFVDGEADRGEADRVFAASGTDPALDRDIGELRKMKALVRHAYEKVPAPPRAAASGRGRHGGAAVAAAVFVLGLGLGWAVSQWHGASRGASPPPPSAALPSLPGVVIQVADRDPAKWQLALEEARIVAEAAQGRRLDVMVIAYGPGLDMLRSESAVRDGLVASLAQGIRLVACGNTMNREHVGARDLLPGVTIAGGGATLEILARQRAGYAYIRI